MKGPSNGGTGNGGTEERRNGIIVSRPLPGVDAVRVNAVRVNAVKKGVAP